MERAKALRTCKKIIDRNLKQKPGDKVGAVVRMIKDVHAATLKRQKQSKDLNTCINVLEKSGEADISSQSVNHK